MWRAQRAFLVALTISLPAYGLDCLAMTTPDEAMECCKAMRCHYHKHRGQNSQDCCKTTPQMHGVPTQPVAALKVTSPSITLAVVTAVSRSESIESHDHVIAPQSHGPPSDAASILPLRI
jgi:hypothetical protein